MNKGELQNLRQSTATFAGMVALFLKVSRDLDGMSNYPRLKCPLFFRRERRSNHVAESRISPPPSLRRHAASVASPPV